jgi:hypothetical protein
MFILCWRGAELDAGRHRLFCFRRHTMFSACAETWEGAFCLQADEQTKEQSAVYIEAHVNYSLLCIASSCWSSLCTYVARKEGRDDMRAAAR